MFQNDPLPLGPNLCLGARRCHRPRQLHPGRWMDLLDWPSLFHYHNRRDPKDLLRVDQIGMAIAWSRPCLTSHPSHHRGQHHLLDHHYRDPKGKWMEWLNLTPEYWLFHRRPNRHLPNLGPRRYRGPRHSVPHRWNIEFLALHQVRHYYRHQDLHRLVCRRYRCQRRSRLGIVILDPMYLDPKQIDTSHHCLDLCRFHRHLGRHNLNRWRNYPVLFHYRHLSRRYCRVQNNPRYHRYHRLYPNGRIHHRSRHLNQRYHWPYTTDSCCQELGPRSRHLGLRRYSVNPQLHRETYSRFDRKSIGRIRNLSQSKPWINHDCFSSVHRLPRQ